MIALLLTFLIGSANAHQLIGSGGYDINGCRQGWTLLGGCGGGSGPPPPTGCSTFVTDYSQPCNIIVATTTGLGL
jgi:hypothetical protein